MTTDQALSELIGLAGAKRLARKLARPDSLVHAVLFYGAAGSGKNSLGLEVAHAWLCTRPTELGRCGECPSCLAAERGRHVDLLMVEPQPPSNLIRLAAVTGNGDQVSIQEFFRTPPLMGRNKVAFVRDADRMNSDAANSFLKTLEEPPARARIVLTTETPGGLLPTILSRCVAAACELPSREELLSYFSAAAEPLFGPAGNAPGRIKQLQLRPGSLEALQELARSCRSLNPRQVLALGERLRGIAEAHEKALGCGARQAQTETLAEFASALQAAGLAGAVPLVIEAHRRVVGNGSFGLALDALFSELSQQAVG